MKPWLHRRLLAVAFAALAVTPAAAADLRVLVTGIESDRGQIRCLLFRGSDGFPLEQDRAVSTVSYPAAMPMLTCTFPGVERGRYAVTVFHDENGNGQLDSKGAQKEPWGLSNDARPDRGAAKFIKAMIDVNPPHASDFEVAVKR